MLTGVFPDNRKAKITKGPLTVCLCKNCSLLQLRHSYDMNELYGLNYGYRSSLNSSMVAHLKNKANSLIKNYKIQKKILLLI